MPVRSPELLLPFALLCAILLAPTRGAAQASPGSETSPLILPVSDPHDNLTTPVYEPLKPGKLALQGGAAAAACVGGGAAVLVPSLLIGDEIDTRRDAAGKSTDDDLLAAMSLGLAFGGCAFAGSAASWGVGRAFDRHGAYDKTLQGGALGMAAGAAVSVTTGVIVGVRSNNDAFVGLLVTFLTAVPLVPLGTAIGSGVGFRRSDEERFYRQLEAPRVTVAPADGGALLGVSWRF